jgi:hypothetical protein
VSSKSVGPDISLAKKPGTGVKILLLAPQNEIVAKPFDLYFNKIKG